MEKWRVRIRHDTFGKGLLLQEATKLCLKLPKAILHCAKANILIV